MTIAQWLKSCGLNPKMALELIAHVLKIGIFDQTAYYVTHQDDKLSKDRIKTLDEYTARIIQGEPIQYVLGHASFGDLDLIVDSRVLIPRPETEELVDLVIRHLNSLHPPSSITHPLVIVDVGTGSGAIAVALAKWCVKHQLPAQIIATDVSKDALKVAELNIENCLPLETPSIVERVEWGKLEIENSNIKIKLKLGHLLKPIKRQVDVIVANLPYIPTSEMTSLPKNVRDFEPHLALDGGAEGLDLITDLINDAKRVLKPNGLIFLELWDEHTFQMLNFPEFTTEIKPDSFGRTRFAVLTQSS